LHKTLRQIRKDLPLEQLIECLNDAEQLRELYHQFDGANDVKDFLLEAANLEAGMQEKLCYFLNQSLENCLYDVPYSVAESDAGVSITEARNIVRNAGSRLQSEIQRIASKFAENPDWNPRRVSRRPDKAVSKADKTERMLGESLLAGFRK